MDIIQNVSLFLLNTVIELSHQGETPVDFVQSKSDFLNSFIVTELPSHVALSIVGILSIRLVIM